MLQVADAQRQLDVVQQITHIGSWEWDRASGAVTWSDELYRIYGLVPRSRPITLDFFLSFVHEADQHLVRTSIAAAIERGGRFHWSERIVRADGSIRTLDTVGEAHRGEDGRVAGLVGTCRDVTEESARSEQIRLYADVVDHVQIGLTVWALDAGRTPRLVTFNRAAEGVARMALGPMVGEELRAIVPYAAGEELEQLVARVAADRGVHEACIERSRDPRDPTRALALKGFPLPGDRVGIAVEDVTAQTLERRLQQHEQQVLEMIARSAPLADSLASLVRAIEDHSPPTIGSVLILDPDGLHVRHGAGPSLPAAFMEAVDGSPIGPRAGSCGTSAFLKKTVIVEDIETDPLWEHYRTLARAHGLRACWSAPILATDDRVLGTFAFYYRTPRTPAPRDLAIIERAARLAGIAIERKQLEEQLQDLSARMESVLEAERTGIAREIHDELGQGLTALKMDVAWVVRRLTDPHLVRPQLIDKLSDMSRLIDSIIAKVRRISSDLRPGVLDDLGLVAAVEWLAQDFETRTATAVSVHANGDEHPLSRSASTAVFRVLQEALTNVIRHAHATHVDVRIDVERDSIALGVRDDGVGITPEAALSPRSLGLVGIRERARRLGGAASVRPVEPHGTLVSMKLPLAPPGQAPR
jgi:PAS domain S-box-containing protein